MMFKKLVVALISLTLVVGFSSLGFSADSGNARKGKYTFRKSCRSCHNDDGTAASISPDSKTQAQWTRQFKPNKYGKLACKEEWVKLSENDRQDIYTYLHKYAFDSPSPAKCK
jgi:cytochrome c553